MKVLGILVILFLLVCASAGMQDVRVDEAYKTGLKFYNGDGVTKDYAEALKGTSINYSRNSGFSKLFVSAYFEPSL